MMDPNTFEALARVVVLARSFIETTPQSGIAKVEAIELVVSWMDELPDTQEFGPQRQHRDALYSEVSHGEALSVTWEIAHSATAELDEARGRPGADSDHGHTLDTTRVAPTFWKIETY